VIKSLGLREGWVGCGHLEESFPGSGFARNDRRCHNLRRTVKHETRSQTHLGMNAEPQTSTIVRAHYSELDLAADELDHPAWTKAQPIHITRRWSGEGAPVSQHAEARIVWTPDALCVRFAARQTERFVVNEQPLTQKKTLGLWDRDVCEIFVAPDPRHPNRYFEFEAAPTGEWVDLAIQLAPDGRETDFEFDSGMTTAARIASEQLTITMRIPWSDSLPRPQRADQWRVNLFRCVGTGDERYLAWQPTYTPVPNFHVPEVFGWLEFS
jgi:hypothetical protein